MATEAQGNGILERTRCWGRFALFILSEPFRAIGLGYRRRCILRGMMGLPVLWCGLCQGAGFTVEGRLEYFPARNGPLKYYLFEGALSEEKWILKIYEDGKIRQRGHWEYGFEGTNQYTLYYVNHEPYEEAVKKPNYIFINGGVEPRTGPAVTPFTPVHVLWFALRCALYTNEQYPRLPRNMIYGSSVPPETETVEVVYAYRDDGEIDEISLLNPGFLYTLSNKYALPPPYDKGYVAARLKVLGREKVGSLTIPIEFEWCVYNAKVEWVLPPKKSFGISSNDLDVWGRYYGRLTKVTALEGDFTAVPCAPNEDVEMVVNDYRFEEQVGGDGVAYVSRGRFLDPREPEWEKAIKRELAKIQATAAPETRRGAGARVILFAFLLVSFCFLVFLAREHRKQPSPDTGRVSGRDSSSNID